MTPRQRSIYRGTICLILGGGARDFHTQAVITGKLMADEGIDDHHVFPAAYLERRASRLAMRDCVLNRTLIDRTTNQMISDRAPSDYLRYRVKLHDFPGRAGVSRSPCWNNEPGVAQDDFEGFLKNGARTPSGNELRR